MSFQGKKRSRHLHQNAHLTSVPADGGGGWGVGVGGVGRRHGGPSLPCWSAEAASLSPLSKVKATRRLGAAAPTFHHDAVIVLACGKGAHAKANFQS